VATENGQDIHSSLVIPLRIEGKLRWILCIDSSVEEAYDEVDQFVADYICEELPIVYRMFELYQKTLMLSRYDGLTGLMNRRYFEYVFEEKMNRAIYGKKTLIVGLFDLDGLKKINDNYGHHAGDAYIKVFVDILKQTYSGADMLARIGGDEFTALFEDDNLEALSEKFEQIRKTFEKTEISCEGVTFTGSFSYGFAIYPDDSKEMSHLLQLADENMYKDKQRHS
jgi:diguanylate cyclase (GGDEF)-like protein